MGLRMPFFFHPIFYARLFRILVERCDFERSFRLAAREIVALRTSAAAPLAAANARIADLEGAADG